MSPHMLFWNCKKKNLIICLWVYHSLYFKSQLPPEIITVFSVKAQHSNCIPSASTDSFIINNFMILHINEHLSEGRKFFFITY